MEYKKIENEIDNLLHNGGLNPYERKLLRKVKRKFCSDSERLHCIVKQFIVKTIFDDDDVIEVAAENSCLRKELKRLAICNLLSGVAVILTIVAYFLK